MTAMEFPDALDEILEAALLAAGEPLALERLEGLFDDHERPPRRALREALERLDRRHARGALELIETASGYRLRIRSRLSPWVSRLWDERPQRYSRALMETLALIAYRQPVTRGDIEEVRGVAVSSSIMRTLTERGWIRVVGHRDVPGRPAVYATTRAFLDDFGLKTLDSLPPMHELADSDAWGEETRPEDEAPAPAVGEADATAVEDNEIEKPEASASGEHHEQEENDATAGMADARHAETASHGQGLSFSDLQARLAERARQRATVEDDERPGASHSTDETDDS
ncbi:SMC-Scp complex subunit ScpB [Halomonas sp. 328]|uniref:SMC-Scp complex subunit ScpB n=1 Tax=Halomonas sp. 328 TaxID=2776704 RepID=UPI0018A7BD15|nr:SMC-Scp complex subunit ScpB [Halomonas sp. 328]MBF8221828.1 SMC-Scp complex subunit ScpB [Halomonas sp. 328]